MSNDSQINIKSSTNQRNVVTRKLPFDYMTSLIGL